MNCCNHNCNQGRNCPQRKQDMETTRKHPRTLQEAFGPYTDDHIEEPLRPLDAADKIEMFAYTVIGIATLAVLWIWG